MCLRRLTCTRAEDDRLLRGRHDRDGYLGEINRQIVDTTKIPDYVSKAIVASEDRTFYTNSGVDVKGILRALVNNLRGGARQGASTLTQQYVERYFVGKTTDPTVASSRNPCSRSRSTVRSPRTRSLGPT